MTVSEILENSYVVTGGGVRLEQFRRTFSAVGMDGTLPREWRWCRIEGEGSLGNAVAQYSLVRHALESNLPFLVVFEDDAVPCDDAAQLLIEAFEKKSPDTKCITLGWSYDSDPDKGCDRSDKRRVYGSHAYVLFGPDAYLAYIKAWEVNGRADVVLGLFDNSKMAPKNIFAQHTIGESIHLPRGWTMDAQIEEMVDKESSSRFSKAKAICEEMDKKDEMHVAYTIDVQGGGGQACLTQLFVSVASLRAALEKTDRVCIHILYANIPADAIVSLQSYAIENRLRVEFHKISSANLAFMQSFTKNSPKTAFRSWSGIVFARLWIPLFLPKQDRVIYLDTDTIVRQSLKPLWDLDLEGKLVGMNMGTVPEYGYNSGVVLFDCAAIRAANSKDKKPEEQIYNRLTALLKKEAKTYKLPDQTVFNRFFVGNIKEIDRKWNYPPMPGVSGDPNLAKAAIWHFYEGGKPQRNDADDFARCCLEWNRILRIIEGRASK